MPVNGQEVKIAHYTRSKFNSLTTKDSATIYYVEEPDGKIKQYIGNTNVVSDFTESDPTVPAHVKSITSGNISSWNNKFNTPTGTTSQYVRGNGSLASFPSIPSIPSVMTTTEGNTGTATTQRTINAANLKDIILNHSDNKLDKSGGKMTGTLNMDGKLLDNATDIRFARTVNGDEQSDLKGSLSRVTVGVVDNTDVYNPIKQEYKFAHNLFTIPSVRITGVANGTDNSHAVNLGQLNQKTYLKSNTDNRAVDTIPNDYNNKFDIKGLKQNTTLGITGQGTYSALLGIRGWSGDSGGNSHEFALTGDGEIYHRHGATTTWNPWDILAKQSWVTANTRSSSWTPTWSQVTSKPTWIGSSKPSYTAAEVGAVPTSRTINGKALSSNITLTAADVGAGTSNLTIGTTSSTAKAGNYHPTWSQVTSKPSFATVATSGSYNDLSNKPSIPAAQVAVNWNSTSGITAILNKPNLATVATSGSYNDLSNKPTIPSIPSVMGTTEGNTGTATTQRTINAANLKSIILNHSPAGSRPASDVSDWAKKPSLAIGDIPTGSTGSTVALGNHSHSVATTSANGLMTSSDKTKLNGIDTGAQVNRDLATYAQALEGTDNTTVMTPLRVKQVIDTDPSGGELTKAKIDTALKGSGNNSIQLGASATSTGNYSTALGSSASASGTASTALGYNASTGASNYTIRLGANNLSTLSSKVQLTVTSDIRDKADIVEIPTALDFIKDLNPITYVSNDRDNYISEEQKETETYKHYLMVEDYDKTSHSQGTKKGERRRVGLSAQEVRDKLIEHYGSDNYANVVNDNFVEFEERELDIPEGLENKLTMSYETLVPFLIKAIQEQQEQIEELKNQINSNLS